MKNKIIKGLLALAVLTGSHNVVANEVFQHGPLIKGYGKHAKVKQTTPVNADAVFKVAFDVADQGDVGKVNRRFESLARFLNMHVANGVKPENIQLALVVHGKAGFDLLNNAHYQAQYKQDNPNTKLLDLLAQHQTDIYLCGQSAAYYGIENQQLNSNVSMSLSAMTANAQLQQQGYTLNPF